MLLSQLNEKDVFCFRSANIRLFIEEVTTDLIKCTNIDSYELICLPGKFNQIDVVPLIVNGLIVEEDATDTF